MEITLAQSVSELQLIKSASDSWQNQQLPLRKEEPAFVHLFEIKDPLFQKLLWILKVNLTHYHFKLLVSYENGRFGRHRNSNYGDRA